MTDDNDWFKIAQKTAKQTERLLTWIKIIGLVQIGFLLLMLFVVWKLDKLNVVYRFLLGIG